MNKIEVHGIPICLIFFLISIIYFFCVITIYLFLSRFAPEKLRQQNNRGLIGEEEYQYYCDCSCLSTLCPCETISLRSFLRKTCCCVKADSLREVFHCECFRPIIQGTPAYKVDFICCTV
ncbi:Hypothetical protein SRAE_2000146700 [Strongyloides ratti]|uniref:Uncharacterized protein n=1 Tax=Strongyloides ratti TaxID=34506 RepID=A0A090LAJ4_STRRB|nr:Hypothetical protein SRAE_2000146700 [Strongyloides ratti]CEF66801.1 Hypothetical protein SRAE_2000146700 [Strongyloides ratti]